MKKLLKKAARVFAAVAVLASIAVNSYAETTKDSILDEFLEDETFCSIYYGENRAYAERIINDVLARRDDEIVSPRIVSGSTAYVNVDIIKQATAIYCGFASMQQVLRALSLESKVAGTTDFEKQTTLKNEMNALIKADNGTPSSTGVVAYMALVLNNYLNKKLYSWYDVKKKFEDADDFQQYTYDSLANDRPTIMRTDTSKLSYYNGTQYSHYIVADSIDLKTSRICTADCCWTDAYRGHFMVPVEEAYNASSYIICIAH